LEGCCRPKVAVASDGRPVTPLRVFAHPCGQEMPPVVCYPVCCVVALPDQLGVGVQEDRCLDLSGVHILMA
jgi:hypothetical protein